MYIKIITTVLAGTLLLGSNLYAQDKKGNTKKTKSISISNNGISVGTEEKKEKAFEVQYVGMDLGINSIQDKSNYNSTAAQALLQVPDDYRNENLFNLRSGKSWNVNLWPVLTKWRIVNGGGQKIYIGSGVGLQMYNFRFTKPVTYTNEVSPLVYLDSVHTIAKNKLGFTYLSVPLSVVFKTRAAENTWIVYGFGITGGYRISSYVKQVSTEDGKRKNHDKFNFSDFNSCLTAEIGLDGYFRLYASYQITPLQQTGLAQYPFSIGLRFGGI